MSQIQVDNIYNKEATGSPSFPLGANVAGVITATTFKGGAEITSGTISATSVTAASGTFNGPVTIGGTLTYEDVTNIDSVGVITARKGIKVIGGGIDAVGVVTAGNGVNITGNIGLGGATYGAAGEVLTSGGSGANATWTTISAAPQIEATADGAITAGKPCIITSAGKAKQVAETTSNATALVWNSASETTLGTPGEGTTVSSGTYDYLYYDPDSDRVILLYNDTGNNTFYAKLYSTNGDGLTYLSAQQINNNTIHHWSACVLSGRRLLVVYPNGSNGQTRVRVLTINSAADGFDSIGSEYVMDGSSTNAFYREPHAVMTTDNRVVIVSKAANNSCRFPDNTLGVIIGDITGNTVWNYRNYDQITNYTPETEYRSIDYDSTNDVIAFTFWRNTGQQLLVPIRVASGNGAAVTEGTAEGIGETGNIGKNIVKYHANSGSWITAIHQKPSATDYLRIQAHTINSTTLAITSGTPVDYNTQGWPHYGLDVAISNQHLIYVNFINSSQNAYSLSASVSGTTLTVNTSDISQVLTSQSGGITGLASRNIAHNSKILFAAQITNNIDSGTGNTTQVTSNLTTENYIGVANATASDAATATIDVSGSTNADQSSLTPGQKYYVQKNGTLALTEDTVKVFAGTAVAANKLIVNDQQPIPASNSGLQLVESFVNPNAAYVVFDNLTKTNVSYYLIKWSGVTFDSSYNTRNLRAQFKIGSAWITSNSTYQQRMATMEFGTSTNEFWSNYNREDLFLSKSESGSISMGEMHIPMQSPNVTTNSAGNKYCYGKCIQSNYINEYYMQLRDSTSQAGDITGVRIYANSGNTGYTGRFDLYKYVY